MTALANADLTKTGGMMPMKWNLTSLAPYDGESISMDASLTLIAAQPISR
jgi:hypothetical protein